jgi:hypothetical protein
MAITYEPIATSTLGSTVSSITFSSISSAYTDLRLVFTELSVGTGGYVGLQFNTDSGTNYSATVLRGNGSAASSARDIDLTVLTVTFDGVSTSTIPALTTIDIFSYTGSTYKTLLAQTSGDNNGSGFVYSTAGLWRSTAAITSIKLLAQNWNFTAGTTATLYGILKA